MINGNTLYSFNRGRCCCIPCPPQETPFLSNYAEAVGTTQTVANNEHFVFDIDPDILDITGEGILLQNTGDVFIISKPGLYHVEWSLSITEGEQPVVIGLVENGYPASAIASSAIPGNVSSGALVEVTDAPLMLSLHNFGMAVKVSDAGAFGNTAASIRILRFADGAK